MAFCLLGLGCLIFPFSPRCLLPLMLAAVALCALIAILVVAVLVLAACCLTYLDRTWRKKAVPSYIARLDTSLAFRIAAYWNAVLRDWSKIETGLQCRSLQSIGVPAATLIPRLIPVPSFLRA